jgi:hypothetical protein
MENDLYIFAYNNLHMFKPEKLNKKGEKSKAFSYFSTMCKHEAKRISKKTYEFDKTSDDIFENHEILEKDSNISYRINENLVEDSESNFVKLVFFELCNRIRKKINEDSFMKEIDIKIGNALISILENFKHISEPSDSRNSLFFINNRVVDMILEIIDHTEKKADVKKSIKSFKKIYTSLIEDYVSKY